jgi:pilus assembly protein Flp/PilA
VDRNYRDMKNLLSCFIRDDRGQDLIEYALLAGLISLGSIGAITLLGGSLNGTINAVALAVGSVGL